MFKEIFLLMVLGSVGGARQNWRFQNRQEQRRIENLKYSRDIYFMDDLTQRVKALPDNSRIIVPPASARVLLTLQLTKYQDNNRALPGGRVCYFNPQNSQPVGNSSVNSGPASQNCRFMFTTIITGAKSTMQTYIAGPIQLGPDGSATLAFYPPWNQQQLLGFNVKPLSIVILVDHYGNVADSNGRLLTYGELVHVDSFVLSLYDFTPGPPGQNYNNQFAALTGTISGTSLQLNYGMRCNIQGQLGPNCDLVCHPVTGTISTSGPQICNSTITGQTSVCQGNNTYGQNTGQLSNCTVCQYGASSTGTCLSSANFYQYSSSSGVAYGYYVATIVLAVIAAILLIILLAAVLLWLWGNKEEHPDDRRRDWSFRNRNRPDIVVNSKASPTIGQGYRPVNTQPDPAWQPARIQAGLQQGPNDTSSSNGRRGAPYIDSPRDRPFPPLAVPEGSRVSQASSTGSYQNGHRREAAV